MYTFAVAGHIIYGKSFRSKHAYTSISDMLTLSSSSMEQYS